jgi:type III secretion protein R
VRLGRGMVAGAVLFASMIMIPAVALAEEAAPASSGGGSFSWIVTVGVISLVPFLFVSVTSFAKISVVLGILRHAIGTPQIPSATVVTGLALILTFFVMTPVFEEVWVQVEPRLRAEGASSSEEPEVERLIGIAQAGAEPVRGFLRRNASARNVELFHRLAQREGLAEDEQPTADDFRVLAPAFLITELAEAFLVGFLLFLPFLVIDIVVSNVLLSLGMQMLNPLSISLPLKLLLFVLVDGWHLVCYGLVTGYG